MTSPASHLFPDGEHCWVHREVTTSKVFREGRINQTKITLERGWKMQLLKKSIQQQQQISIQCAWKRSLEHSPINPTSLYYTSTKLKCPTGHWHRHCGRAQPQELGGDAPMTSFQVKERGEDRAVLYCQPQTGAQTACIRMLEAGVWIWGMGRNKTASAFTFCTTAWLQVAAAVAGIWLCLPVLVSSSGKQANSTLRENKTSK